MNIEDPRRGPPKYSYVIPSETMLLLMLAMFTVGFAIGVALSKIVQWAGM